MAAIAVLVAILAPDHMLAMLAMNAVLAVLAVPDHTLAKAIAV